MKLATSVFVTLEVVALCYTWYLVGKREGSYDGFDACLNTKTNWYNEGYDLGYKHGRMMSK